MEQQKGKDDHHAKRRHAHQPHIAIGFFGRKGVLPVADNRIDEHVGQKTDHRADPYGGSHDVRRGSGLAGTGPVKPARGVAGEAQQQNQADPHGDGLRI